MTTLRMEGQPRPAASRFGPGREIGRWAVDAADLARGAEAVGEALERVAEPFVVLGAGPEWTMARAGGWADSQSPDGPTHPVLAYVPAVHPSGLGDPAFLAAHGLAWPYVTGAMANGIASEALVESISRVGGLGFFGAAGLPPARVEAAIDRLESSLGVRSGEASGDWNPARPVYGFNLINSPSEPMLEESVVDLYLRRGVRLVEASAYLALTPALVRYRLSGIHRAPDGGIVTPNRVVAKVSRVEVATRFFSPAPEKYVRELVARGALTAEQAELAESVPMAVDLTAEADSGGHTDNQPFIALVPTMLALRDEIQSKYGYAEPLRVGAGGGLGTPAAVAAAFAMGVAYVVTGSVNQACVESGASDAVRAMLAGARQADVAMAPAADMFEMGVKLQVLKRGTMFPMRAAKLYEAYRAHERWSDIPEAQRAVFEKEYFRAGFDEIWIKTRSFFAERDPRQVEKGDRDERHRMALVFRWYLGLSSAWANQGDPSRVVDYQVWCGPSMGAFNEWAKGSFLEAAGERRVDLIALNLLHGAAALTRKRIMRAQLGCAPPGLRAARPRTMPELRALLNS